jgi:hypothetical protein
MTTPNTIVPPLPWEAANPYQFCERHRSGGGAVWDTTAQVLGGSGWSIDPLANPNARSSVDSRSRMVWRALPFRAERDADRDARCAAHRSAGPKVADMVTRQPWAEDVPRTRSGR